MTQYVEEMEVSKSADNRKSWRYPVRPNDTLEGIAERYYGDPSKWKQIARQNNIENPRRIAPGTILNLPPIDE